MASTASRKGTEMTREKTTVNGKFTYKFVTVILHTMIYRNGELIAILPRDYKEGWGRVMAEVIFDVIEDDSFESAPF